MKVENYGSTMKVRVRQPTWFDGVSYIKDQVRDLEWDRALKLLDIGIVEPDFDLMIYRPRLDMDGMTIWEACLHHVREFPPLKPLLDSSNVQFRPNYLYVRHFANMPKWQGVVAKAHSFRDRCQMSLRDYLRRVAIHHFLKRLANEELNTEGVSESDLDSLTVSPIPPGWWRRNILLDFRTNEIWERVAHGQDNKVRRFSEVRIKQIPICQKKRRQGASSRRDDFLKAFDQLLEDGSLIKADLRSKKGVWNKVLQRLGWSEHMRGCSYNTFVAHVGPRIDQVLETRDSEM